VTFQRRGFGSGAALAATLLAALALTSACDDGELRGHSKRSSDGKTYLVVEDDNGGACGPMIVDGVKWPHRLHRPGPVSPGKHVITCGDDLEGAGIEFHIRAGTTFYFDYWGP
jgi:hypothetical protein